METIIRKYFQKNLFITFFGEVSESLIFGALEVPPEI